MQYTAIKSRRIAWILLTEGVAFDFEGEKYLYHEEHPHLYICRRKKTKAKNMSGNGSKVTKWNFQWSPLNKRCSLSVIFGGKPFADSWRELTLFNRKWPGFPKLLKSGYSVMLFFAIIVRSCRAANLFSFQEKDKLLSFLFSLALVVQSYTTRLIFSF